MLWIDGEHVVKLVLTIWLVFGYVGIDGDRAWILSTMKSAAMAAQASPPRLACFQSDVLGLARVCDKLAATGPIAERKFHHSRVVDLWSLFPCFCKSPIDIEAAMPSLTTTLGRALDDKRYPELLVRFLCCRRQFLELNTLTDASSLLINIDGYLSWAHNTCEGYGAVWRP